MGRDLKKTLPNPECELFLSRGTFFFFFFKDKTMVLWEKT